MSGGTVTLNGRQFLELYGVLGSTNKRGPGEKHLQGKMRRRIEKLLQMDRDDGPPLFRALEPEEYPIIRDGKPVIQEDGTPAKGWKYPPDSLKAPAGELRFDSAERATIINLLQERTEHEDATGEISAQSIQIAGWLNMGEELETRILVAHPVTAFSGKLDGEEVG